MTIGRETAQDGKVPSFPWIRAGVFFALAILLFCGRPRVFAADAAPSDNDKEPSETELLEKQRGLEKDMEKRVQGVLDKVFGPNQSEVKATINLSILREVQRKSGQGQQQKKKEDNPLGDTKFILPGVPAPKNVAKDKEPDNVDRTRAEQERQLTKVSFKVVTNKRELVALYNEKLKNKEADARAAVMALTDLKPNELKFVPSKFFSSSLTFWEAFMQDPKNLLYSVMLFLVFLLLVWLFIPLLVFFAKYIRALKEKAGIEVKMESTSEDEMEEENENEGLTPEELAQKALEEEGGEEEMPKKYVPFEYISEENMKRLLGVFRKEPPQVIALVLSYLKPELVKTIYSELPPDLQTKVAAEASAVRQATEEQVRMVDENIKAKIDFVVGGVDNLIKLLDEVDYKIRDNILEYLMNHKPQLYDKVRSSILLFEDFVKFPDPAVQTILRELKTDQLARALRNASPEIMNKFFSNMSQGGAALLKEEMEFGRPVTEEQVEQERQEIMGKVKGLEAEGKIQIREKKKISVFESEDATSPLLPSLPDEEPFGRRAGESLGTAQQPEAAAPAPAASPEEAQSYLAYGEQLYGENRYEEALSYLQYAAELDPASSRAFQVLGHCHYALGRTAEALQCYEYALSLSPEDEALREWVAQFKQSAGV